MYVPFFAEYRRAQSTSFPATSDRAPEHLAGGTPPALRDDLIRLLGPAAVLSRVTDLVKYATDASPYRLFPQVVVVGESLEQMAKVLQYAKQNHHSVTFRAAGPSVCRRPLFAT